MSNNSSSSGIHLTTDNNIETASIDYTLFHQDTNLEFVDVKKCLTNFSYHNEWEALLISSKEIKRNIFQEMKNQK